MPQSPMPFVASLSPDQQKHAAREYRKGRSLRDIGNELGVSLHTIRRCVARQRVTIRRRGGELLPRDVDPDDADRLRKLYNAIPAYGRGRRTASDEAAELATELRRLNDGGLPLEALGAALGLSEAAVHHIIKAHLGCSRSRTVDASRAPGHIHR